MKKIRLHRETLRELTHREQQTVVGGLTENGGEACESLVGGASINIGEQCMPPEPTQGLCQYNTEIEC